MKPAEPDKIPDRPFTQVSTPTAHDRLGRLVRVRLARSFLDVPQGPRGCPSVTETGVTDGRTGVSRRSEDGRAPFAGLPGVRAGLRGPARSCGPCGRPARTAGEAS
ncbi:hypothetical protein GCM10027073_35260 [Streptomyces chlorus]